MLSEALIDKYGFAQGLETKENDETGEIEIVSFPDEWGKKPTKTQLAKIVSEYELRSTLKEIRNDKINAGIDLNGIRIETDDVTQSRMMAVHIKAMQDDTYTVNWKTKDGFIVLDAGTIMAISEAMHNHVQACFTAESNIDIGDVTDIADLVEQFGVEYDTAYNGGAS